MERPFVDNLTPADFPEERVWELYHENSKVDFFQRYLSEDEITRHIESLHEVLPYRGYPNIPLKPSQSLFTCTLETALKNRASTRRFSGKGLSFDQLTCLFTESSGITHSPVSGEGKRSFRAAPSAGALFPLELYFHTNNTEHLQPGIYHFNPSNNSVQLLRHQDLSEEISASLLQPEIGLTCPLMVFFTAIFDRSSFKYGERAYRYILLEAGHLAQNFNLVASALNLASVNIGGYLDRKIDKILGLDGVTHSTIYLMAIGNTYLPNEKGEKYGH